MHGILVFRGWPGFNERVVEQQKPQETSCFTEFCGEAKLSDPKFGPSHNGLQSQIHIYIYIYTRNLGPPKAGQTESEYTCLLLSCYSKRTLKMPGRDNGLYTQAQGSTNCKQGRPPAARLSAA